MDESESAGEYSERFVHRRYKCNFAEMATAEDVIVGESSELLVLFGLKHEGGVYLSCQDEPMPLSVFTRGDTHVAANDVEEGATSSTDADAAHWNKMVLEFPWFAHLDQRSGFAGGDTGEGARKKAKLAASKLPDIDEVDEDAVLEGLAELEKARAALADDLEERGEMAFYPVYRGGRSTIIEQGVASDAVQSNIVERASLGVRAWCKRHGLNITFKATLSQYSRDESHILTRGWCHRMQFF